MGLDKELLEKLNCIEPRIKIENKYFELNQNGWLALKNTVKSIENKDKYIIELKNKHRSYKQLQLYWSGVLPSILYFLREDIKVNDIGTLHVYLKGFYAYSKDKSEYFKTAFINGEKVLINTFSIDFKRCKQDEFNNYLNFIENNLNSLITLEVYDFEELIDAFAG